MPGGAHENMRGWSPEEDELLLNLIDTSGKRWKFIAEQLGNANPRTPAMVRNRYLRIERGRFLTEQGLSKNRCGQCGELKRGHVCRAPRALVSTNMASQEMRHHDVRRVAHDERRGLTTSAVARVGAGGDVGGSCPAPPSPSTTALSSGSTPTKSSGLNLGAAAPLTYVGTSVDTDNTMSLASPDILAFGLSPSGPRSGMSLGLPTFGGATPGGVNPPGLRPQSSFDMLLKASELRSNNSAARGPVHATATMKILADTPNSSNADFPFSTSGFGPGGSDHLGTPAIPSPGDLIKSEALVNGLTSPLLCSQAEGDLARVAQQRRGDELVEASSVEAN